MDKCYNPSFLAELGGHLVLYNNSYVYKKTRFTRNEGCALMAEVCDCEYKLYCVLEGLSFLVTSQLCIFWCITTLDKDICHPSFAI